ncbi:hypothetical protein RvY_00654 [Ramazzottius varieornatus]|uniref:Uncharacterized protein n=1 Tax=Ramazzottius varieornatus TaxID=947166 RepID=A0A1D1UH66_RAMVA|nr:hypothetical protein RvY_00654 [Ramazzottius varieornatus]
MIQTIAWKRWAPVACNCQVKTSGNSHLIEGTPPYFPVNTYPHQVMFLGISQRTLRQTGPQTLVVQVIPRSTIWRSLQMVVKDSRFDLYSTRRDDRQVKFSRRPYRVSALTTSQKFIID